MPIEKPKAVLKWMIGLVILAIFYFYGRSVFNQEQALGIFLVVGLGLGYVESRSEVGIASGYTEFFVTGNRSRLYGLLLLFGFGALGALYIHYQSAQNGAVPSHLASGSQSTIPGTKAVTPVNFGLILGSFLFGVGLTINQGCGLGTLRNIGQGKLRYLWTLLFLFIGTIPGQMTKYVLDQSAIHQYSVELYLPELFGYGGTAVLVVAILAVLAFVAERYETLRKKAGTEKDTEPTNLPDTDKLDSEKPMSKRIFDAIFKIEWSRFFSVLLITLLFLLALNQTGEKLSVTQPLLYPAVSLFQSLGFSFEHPAFSEAVQIVDNGLLNNTNIIQNFGIIFGAMIFALTSTNFSFSLSMNLKESVWYMLGGFLMGFGAVLASGCIVGALYSGIVNFSLSGWVVFGSMSVGIWLTVKVLNGRVSTIPKIGA